MNIAMLFILLFVNKIHTLNLKKISFNISLKGIVLVLSTVLILLLIVYNGLPSLDAFDLTKVYEVRGRFNSGSTIERVQSLYTYVIVPMLTVNSIRSKKNIFYFY